ncbi:MAG: hypothetical protein JSV16_08105 [Candidatus Hydrogenedentota bacterium]|nr:MAG: hypothetical protein JSV16_08105 [Candidatus Hydrogenedentota bacterium]
MSYRRRGQRAFLGKAARFWRLECIYLGVMMQKRWAFAMIGVGGDGGYDGRYVAIPQAEIGVKEVMGVESIRH